tara:strand:+ start:18617 stop:24574 length:5958 start_codon:yes stop_codon:yes gene_type:complete
MKSATGKLTICKSLSLSILLFSLLTLCSKNLLAQPGSLDPGFSADGKQTTDFGGFSDEAYAVGFQSDGKIIVAGYSFVTTDDFAVARYNTDGSLDATFGTAGKVITPIGTFDDYGWSLAIQSDDKIVVAGYSFNGSNEDFALVRYTSNGALDTSFDTDGILTTAIGTGDDQAFAVAIQSDGKILAAGRSHNGSNFNFALVRYNTDGSLDTSFDTDGKLTTPNGSAGDEAWSIAIQPDGKIVLAGTSTNLQADFTVVRYNTNGSLDTGFDTDGKVTVNIGSGTADDQAYSVALQSDGKIVVGGSYNSGNLDFALARLNSDGSLDTGFGTAGKVITAVGISHETGRSVAIQADGKILLAGWSNNGSNYDFALVRYNTDGSLDGSFGTAGKVITPFGTSNDHAYAIGIQSDKKIVLAGRTNASTWDMALARYIAVIDQSITSSYPLSGVVGTEVTITGTGFSTTPADNAVAFNGTTAIVTASTATTITTSVPAGASSGPITVTVAGNTVASDGDFYVTAASIAMGDGNSQGCDFQFTDSGGQDDYGSSEDFTYTFAPENPGEKIKVSFLSFDTETSEYLIAYDGPDTSSPFLSYMSGSTVPKEIIATSATGEVTFYFHSDNDGERPGWEALVSCVTDLITIDTQPLNYTGCVGDIATFGVAASGTTNLTYQWQESDYEGGWYDLTDADGFSGTSTSVLSVNTAAYFGQNYYRCMVSGDLSSNAFADEVYLEIGPDKPAASNVVNCGPTSFTLTASGGAEGQFRWYTTSTGGSPIIGETSSTYTTPPLTSTAYYYVAINDGTCESERSEIQAGISTCEPEPGFVWALGAGSGGGTSAASETIYTSDGNLLVFGSYGGTIDFDTGPGEAIITATGSDAYMFKLDPDGNLLWVKTAQGTGVTSVAAASEDGAGNLYVLFRFYGTTDFDPGAGEAFLTSVTSSPNNKSDLAIGKYDADGNFIWVRQIGGNSDEFGGEITTDADGNAYVTGAFRGTTSVGGVFTLTARGSGSTDALFSKLDTDGNFLWAKSIGSDATTAGNLYSDNASGVALDGSSLYITGRLHSSGVVDFDPGAGTANYTLTSGTTFILKLNSDGIYQSHQVIENSGASGSIGIDSESNIYVCGQFTGTIDIDPGPGTFEVTATGDVSSYLVKLNSAGNFVWGLSFGGQYNSFAMGNITIDADDNIFTSGYFQSTTDFDPSDLVESRGSNGLFLNTFTLKLDKDANFKWVIDMRKIDGGFTSTSTGPLALSPEGDIYLVGGFARHIDFDPSECVFEMNNVNGTDFFVRKVSPAVPTVCFDAEPVNKFACTGSTATFATTVLGSDPYNFQWQKLNTSTSIYEDISNAGGYSGATTSTLSINTTGDFGAGTYRCKVSGSTIIDDFSTSAVLTIGPLATPTATDASTCTPESVTLTASGATAGQYRWYDVETGGTAIEGEVSSSFVTPELSETSIFYVAINNGSCESERVPVTATLNAALAPPSASDVTVCADGTAVLTAAGGTDGQYRWYDVESGGIANIGETNGIYTTPALSATSTYYVAINDGNCESTRTAVVATVNSPPSAPSTTDAVICGSGSAAVTASGGSDGQYRWYNTETGGTAIADEVNGAYSTPNLSATTTYYVSINDGFCESARTAVTASISPDVTPPTTTDVSICAPESVTLTASGGADGEYRWYDVETAGTAISGEVNSTLTTPVLSATTSYYVAITNGTCESSRTPVTVEIGSDVTPPTAAEVSICPDESATLTATGGTNGSYRWYEVATGGTGVPNQVNSTLVTPALSSDATYYVAINDGTCESTRVPVAISLLQEVAITDQPADQTVEVGEPASFSVTASGSNLTYQWQKDLVNLEGETSAELALPAVSLESEGSYLCIISNDCGSLVSEAAILTVLEPVVGQNGDEIIVYNAVAPNGNNKNEFLKIANIESHPGNSVEIYDRWGVKVFQVSGYDNQDPNARFEGRSNVGSSLNLVEGTYFYLIQASGQKLTGFLHLRR